MKDYQTTLAGLAAGLAALQYAVSNGADIGRPSTWWLPVALALVGFFAGDRSKRKK